MIGSGSGSGYGYGDGDGYGSGYGYGDGDGSGSGYGYGDGDGDGDGYGYGSGSGSGYGYGYGSGYGDASEVRVLATGDPRGYRCLAVRASDGWRISAGCRTRFTLDDALEHWGSPDYPEPAIGLGYVLELLKLREEADR